MSLSLNINRSEVISIMSHPYEPHQQLMAVLWPECSDASAPWQRGFSPQSGDNGLSTAAWLAVHRVICRMSVSAESRPVKRGEGRGGGGCTLCL